MVKDDARVHVSYFEGGGVVEYRHVDPVFFQVQHIVVDIADSGRWVEGDGPCSDLVG